MLCKHRIWPDWAWMGQGAADGAGFSAGTACSRRPPVTEVWGDEARARTPASPVRRGGMVVSPGQGRRVAGPMSGCRDFRPQLCPAPQLQGCLAGWPFSSAISTRPSAEAVAPPDAELQPGPREVSLRPCLQRILLHPRPPHPLRSGLRRSAGSWPRRTQAGCEAGEVAPELPGIPARWLHFHARAFVCQAGACIYRC